MTWGRFESLWAEIGTSEMGISVTVGTNPAGMVLLRAEREASTPSTKSAQDTRELIPNLMFLVAVVLLFQLKERPGEILQVGHIAFVAPVLTIC